MFFKKVETLSDVELIGIFRTEKERMDNEYEYVSYFKEKSGYVSKEEEEYFAKLEKEINRRFNA